MNIPSLASIQSARERLKGMVLRTPLIPFDPRSNDFSSSTTAEIYLKLENLQPTGSFKVRGAGNALLSVDPSRLKQGVWTVSAGNMGQALAWFARKLKIDCTVIVPDDAPEVKG